MTAPTPCPVCLGKPPRIQDVPVEHCPTCGARWHRVAGEWRRVDGPIAALRAALARLPVNCYIPEGDDLTAYREAAANAAPELLRRLDEAERDRDAAIADRNANAGILWRALGCPPGAIDGGALAWQATAALDAARHRLRTIADVLPKLKREHANCPKTWPASVGVSWTCDCGADAFNATVDDLVRLAKE